MSCAFSRVLVLGCLVLFTVNPAMAQVEPAEPPEALFTRATAALSKGAFNDAIAEYEQLSDLGVASVAVSWNRGLAYLQRAESGKSKPGDWGQAAAGFREAALLGAGAEAHDALEQVRQRISRARAQKGLDPVVMRPALGQSLVQWIPEGVWVFIAALGSLALTVGLVLLGVRRTDTETQNPIPSSTPFRLTGQIMTGAGVFLLLLGAGFTFAAQHLRHSLTEAVVITTEARLLDEQGQPLTARALDVETTAVPEGASVFVKEQRGRLARARWGTTEAWLAIDRVRLLARE